MKITELDGLIKLEADKNKVLTTLVPSKLITTLIYLGIGDSVDNYIEIDEEPEIEIPEEPELEQPEEILDGYTLVEAYYKLINENRVLIEQNKSQYKLLDISMTAINELYSLIEPMLPEDTETLFFEKMINMYVEMIKNGNKDENDIPIRYREQVKSILSIIE